VKKNWATALRLHWIAWLLLVGQSLPHQINAEPYSQAAAATPLRLGDLARSLSAADIASIELALPAGGKPWLIAGDFGQARSSQSVEAYLPPDPASAQLRRGSMIRLSRRITDPSNPGPWAIDNSVQQGGMQTRGGFVGHPPNHGPYAQVAIEGRTFQEFSDDQDQNRPFLVEGSISDAELIDIVAFIRPKPPLFGAGPIQAVVLGSNGSVTVWTRLRPLASEWWILQKLGETWKVVGTGVRQA